MARCVVPYGLERAGPPSGYASNASVLTRMDAFPIGNAGAFQPQLMAVCCGSLAATSTQLHNTPPRGSSSGSWLLQFDGPRGERSCCHTSPRGRPPSTCAQ